MFLVSALTAPYLAATCECHGSAYGGILHRHDLCRLGRAGRTRNAP